MVLSLDSESRARTGAEAVGRGSYDTLLLCLRASQIPVDAGLAEGGTPRASFDNARLDTPTEMNRKTELGAFLRAQRAKIHPEDTGLVTYGERRRVKGLRREELAQLAGLSVTYYTRLEQGRVGNVSDSVLNAVARVLDLTDEERVHVSDLARGARNPRRPAQDEDVSPAMRALLAQVGDVPGLLVGRRGDVLAWNPTAHALYAPDLDIAAPDDELTRPNMIRRLFASEYGSALYVNREQMALQATGYLRLAAARYPDDPDIEALVAELNDASPEFARLWGTRDVSECRNTTYQFRNARVGVVTASEEIMALSNDPGQRLTLVTAEPGSPSERALRLLATLAATDADERMRTRPEPRSPATSA